MSPATPIGVRIVFALPPDLFAEGRLSPLSERSKALTYQALDAAG
jgi:hypothetical protein